MAFELVNKGSHFTKKMGEKEISVMKTGFSFGLGIEEDFKQNGLFCEVYIDYEGLRMGFKPTHDSMKGFKMQTSGEKRTTAYISLPQISKKVFSSRYEARKEGDIWVINVKEIVKE